MNTGNPARTAVRLNNGSLPPFAKKISFKPLRKGRKEFSEPVQFITGHNFLQRHKVIVQEDVDPLCRSCGEDEETSHHVVAECPAFASIRLRVLGTPVGGGSHCRIPGYVTMAKRHNGEEKLQPAYWRNFFFVRGVILAKISQSCREGNPLIPPPTHGRWGEG